MNKKYLLYAIVLVGLLGSIGAVAYASQNQERNLFAGISARISQRFNLNQNDVQAVFDEYKSEMGLKMGQGNGSEDMQERMKEKAVERLNQAVEGGELTQAQADLIIAKKAELETQRATFRENLEGKTKAEMQETMKAHRESIEQWAEDNNIPSQYLMMFGGPRGAGGGFGFGR